MTSTRDHHQGQGRPPGITRAGVDRAPGTGHPDRYTRDRALGTDTYYRAPGIGTIYSTSDDRYATREHVT